MSKAKKLTRIKLAKEPSLSHSFHRWVVEIKGKRGSWFRYCRTLRDVRSLITGWRRKPEVVFHVFKAHHEFKEGWRK